MKVKQPNFADSFSAGYEHGIKIGFDFAARQFMQPVEHIHNYDSLIEAAVDQLWLDYHGETK